MADLFKAELQGLQDKERVVSASRIKSLTKLAIKHIKDYKAIIAAIEEFAEKTPSGFKLHALYLIDSICQASRSAGKKDIYVRRFASNILQTFESLSNHDARDTERFRKVLKIWRDRHVFRSDYMDMMDSLIELNPNALVDAAPEMEEREKQRRALKQRVRRELEQQQQHHDDDDDDTKNVISDHDGDGNVYSEQVVPVGKRNLPESTSGERKQSKTENILSFDYGDEDDEELGEEDKRKLVEMQERLKQSIPENKKIPDVVREEPPRPQLPINIRETKRDNGIQTQHDIQYNPITTTTAATNLDGFYRQSAPNVMEIPTSTIDPYAFLFGADAKNDIPTPSSYHPQHNLPLPMPYFETKPVQTQNEVSAGSIRVLTRTVLLSNVSRGTSEERIRAVCSYYGTIDHIAMFNDRGHAFVKFMTRRDAEKARVSLKDYNLDGNYLKAEWYSAFGPKQYFNTLTGILDAPIHYLNDRDRELLNGAFGTVEEPFPPQRSTFPPPAAIQSLPPPPKSPSFNDRPSASSTYGNASGGGNHQRKDRWR